MPGYEFNLSFIRGSRSGHLSLTVSIRTLFNQEKGGETRGEGSVVAYGYATHLALYYTHLALLCLLVVAGQRNVYLIFT